MRDLRPGEVERGHEDMLIGHRMLDLKMFYIREPEVLGSRVVSCGEGAYPGLSLPLKDLSCDGSLISPPYSQDPALWPLAHGTVAFPPPPPPARARSWGCLPWGTVLP